MFWFRAGSVTNPTFIYSHRNSGDECETSPEAQSLQKCLYSFSKNFSSSDTGTYYCAVATCGEILFGNGTKLDVEGIIVLLFRKLKYSSVKLYNKSNKIHQDPLLIILTCSLLFPLDNVSGPSTWSPTADALIYLLCAALAISLVVIAFLLYCYNGNRSYSYCYSSG